MFRFLGVGREHWVLEPTRRSRWFCRTFGHWGMYSKLCNYHAVKAINSLPLPRNARVLDAGCGVGFGCFLLKRVRPHYQVVGVDLSEKHIDDCRQIAGRLNVRGVEFNVGKLEELSYLEHFDLIYSVDTLEHIDDDHKVMQNFLQTLKAGGYLVVHVPKNSYRQRRYLPVKRYLPDWAWEDVTPHARDEYTREEIEALVRQAGFKVVKTYPCFGPFGAMSIEINWMYANDLYRNRRWAVLTYPLTSLMAYLDTLSTDKGDGNSTIVVAQKPGIAA